MKYLLPFFLLFSVAVTGCSSPTDHSPNRTPKDNGSDRTPKKNVQVKSPGPVELHFALLPVPRLIDGKNEVLLPGLAAFVTSRKAPVAKWTVYFPDDVPVNVAIELFAQLEKAGCSGVAVYAENARGDCAKRDLCVDVGPTGPVQVVTECAQACPESLKEYVGTCGKDLLVTKRELSELGPVLQPLMEMWKKKHVRLMESGGLEGLPASRYVEALKAFISVGVETVSFYGVYVE